MTRKGQMYQFYKKKKKAKIRIWGNGRWPAFPYSLGGLLANTLKSCFCVNEKTKKFEQPELIPGDF